MRAAVILSALIALLPAGGGAQGSGDAAAGGPVDCQVAGYDVLIFNRGDAPLPAGTEVDWEVRFARAGGRHRLADDLAPGRFALMVGALGESYLRPQVKCEARLAAPGG
ncbi:MAG: hypothetical protein KJZ85_15910 [Rhodobacteraceae bacterium]|jgi:hypothetical protein|nr:hypothetical protein [Paracoccaceae bacterium]